MRYLLLVAVCCLSVGSQALAQQPANDLDQLQGEWQAVEFVASGYDLPKRVVDHLKIVIKDDHLSYTLPKFDDPTRPSNVKVNAEIVLGPGAPSTIDVRMVQGRTKIEPLRGVYELRGDTLRICLPSGEPGAGTERLTTLGPSKASKATQLTLKRCADPNQSPKIAGNQIAR